MDAAIKAEWVAALRSGEYVQGKKMLCNEDGAMCCLGVLIDACIDGEWEFNDYSKRYSFKNESGRLPHSVLERTRLTETQVNALIHRNDGIGRRPASFRTIADFIEASF